MSVETHEKQNGQGHGGFERSDIGVREIIYFLVGLAVATVIVHFFLAGMYAWLDSREKTQQQTPMSPLVATVPGDTRQITEKYPQTAFPDPRLETDERNQLNNIRMAEEEKLNSYGWVDERAGTVHIPIERAMELIAQRGLPVRNGQAQEQASAATAGSKKKGSKR